MKDEKLHKIPSSLKELSIGMLYYTSASIFGPLVFFGIIGYLLDQYFGTKPIILILSILVAFFITNILIYKKIKVLIKKFDELDSQEKIQKIKDNNQK